MNKFEFVDSYICRCDEVINTVNINGAKKLQDEIIGVFESEITDIKNQLDNYSGMGLYNDNYQVDYIGDIRLIKQKLKNYTVNIQRDKEKMEYDLEIARLRQPQVSAHAEANPTQTATASSNVVISIKQVIKQIEEIPEDSLSSDDKDTLKEYLFSLEGIKAANDKNKFWTKTKEVLRFLADKGADATIATLPLILSGLR